MTPTDLQNGKLCLQHSAIKINSYIEELHFYKGSIDQLQHINEPCFILYSQLTKAGSNGQELEFEHLNIEYIMNLCNNKIPIEATHFFLVSEPPISVERAQLLQNRFSADSTNFTLKYPVQKISAIK